MIDIGGWFRILAHNYAETVNTAYPECRAVSWQNMKAWLSEQPGLNCKRLGTAMWETLSHHVYEPMWS